MGARARGLSGDGGERPLGDTEARELQEALARLTNQDPTLGTLDLAGRPLGPRGCRLAAEPLARALHLTHLDLSHTSIGPRGPLEGGIRYVARALAQNTTLRSVNLAGNGLGRRGMEAVSRMVRLTVSLREVGLFNNAIGDDGIALLAPALATNRTVRRLHLGHNLFTDQGAASLLDVFTVAGNPVLCSVGLQGNDISDTVRQTINRHLATNLVDQSRAEVAGAEAEARTHREIEELEDRRELYAAVAEAEAQLAERLREKEDRRGREAAEEKARLAEEVRMREETERAERGARGAARADHVDRLVNVAYAWRETLRGGERRGREWRSGFSSFKDTAPLPTAIPPLPRRLLTPCWCEPPDPAVLFSGKLHYHCLLEPEVPDDGRYAGCDHTPHRCRSAPLGAHPQNTDSVFGGS